MSFNLIRSGGPFIRDPRLMPRMSVPAGNLVRTWYNSSIASDANGFWTGAVGAIDRAASTIQNETDWVNDTYKTIVGPINGPGLVSAVVGPIANTSGVAFTVRFTIDGVSYEVRATSAESARCLIGCALPTNFFGGGSSTAGQAVNLFSHDGVAVDGKTSWIADNVLLLGPQEAFAMGMPLLHFSSNLMVEVKLGESHVGEGSTYRKCAVLMMLS